MNSPEQFDDHRLRRREPEALRRWFLDHADAVYTFVYYRVGRDRELAAESFAEDPAAGRATP